jgi:hypothetical protein
MSKSDEGVLSVGASPHNRPRPRLERVIWSRIRAANQRLGQGWLKTLGTSRTRTTTRTITTVLGSAAGAGVVRNSRLQLINNFL